MSSVEVMTYLRQTDGALVPLEDCGPIARRDCSYLPGSIAVTIDGAAIVPSSLWDDVNWLWPSVVSAVDDYRRTGWGEVKFPSQPITFRLEKMSGWKPMVRVTVVAGKDRQRAIGDPDAFCTSVAAAGLEFFETYLERCPSQTGEAEAIATIDSWGLGGS